MIAGVAMAALVVVATVAFADRAAGIERGDLLARGSLAAGVLTGLLALAVLVRAVERRRRRERTELALRHQAFTDSLTGLPNRAALELALADRVGADSQGDGAPQPVVLCLLDLDDLKTVNDSLGHGSGDELVRAIAARIAAVVGPDVLVARFGADEFGLLLPQRGADAASAMNAGVACVEQVVRAIRRPVLLDERELRISASAGIACGTGVETVVRDADIAMYAAKAGGKNCVRIFTSAMRDEAVLNLELTADLRRALADDELYLEYQPVVDLSTGRVTGVEALVRWMHPVRGRISPLDFIGVAERSGLIGPLGWWVMRTACRQMRQWIEEGSATADQHVSVNVSPIQLGEPAMAHRIERILAETELSPQQLQLEITESVLVEQPDQLVADLSELMSLGIRIAIDDFGTGHSALAYLRDLPVDVLKIDKAFVDHVEHDVSRARLTQGIVQLAQSLDLGIVAEGIETAAQASFLGALGSMLGQGYLYSRPLPAAQAGEVLRRGTVVLPSANADRPAA